MYKITIIAILTIFSFASCGKTEEITGQNNFSVDNNQEQGEGDVEGYLSSEGDGELLGKDSGEVIDSASTENSRVSDENPFNF